MTTDPVARLRGAAARLVDAGMLPLTDYSRFRVHHVYELRGRSEAWIWQYFQEHNLPVTIWIEAGLAVPEGWVAPIALQEECAQAAALVAEYPGTPAEAGGASSPADPMAEPELHSWEPTSA